MQRGASGRSPRPLRRGRAVRRPDLVGDADLALPAAPALCARQLPARAWRRYGIGGFAGLCARPREPAVCKTRFVPGELRRSAAGAAVATRRRDCRSVVAKETEIR